MNNKLIYQVTGRMVLLFGMLLSFAQAQDDFLSALEESAKPEFVSATFKGTRLVGMPTCETQGKGTLEFRVAHRFGDFSSGGKNFWGLDGGATIQLSFDYSLSDRLSIGIGRSSYQKFYDSNVKYKLFQQTTSNKMPVSVTVMAMANFTDQVDPGNVIGRPFYRYKINRFSYVHMVMIARKFGERFSFQLSPTHIHYNVVEKITDKNSILALGTLSRIKVSKRIAVTGEYIFRLNKYTRDMSNYHNSFSLGADIETGGHVFQVYVANSSALNPAQFIPYTTSNWGKGQVRLGFNISRVF